MRNREFLIESEGILDKIETFGFKPEILFLDADNSDIRRRYSETRRSHPLALENSIDEGIRREREYLSLLRHRASITIDSTQLTPHQLRARVVSVVCGQKSRRALTLQLQSFGFRYGLPPDSDMVIDVRFLPNPHFVAELQKLTGLDERVRNYIVEKQECLDFLKQFMAFIGYLIPCYQREGKSYLTVSIGCTGGRHRSVVIVEELLARLPSEGLIVKSSHRDTTREEAL